MAQRRVSKFAALKKLRARWSIFLFAGLALIVIGNRFLRQVPFAAENVWLVIAGLAFVWQSLFFFVDLSKNEPKDKKSLLPLFGIGTWLSLFRLLLLSLTAGFLFSPRPEGWLAWAPFGLYLVFNLTDLVDGYAARRWGQTTRLGEKLDLDLDSRGMLVGCLLAVQYGSAGWWYVSVGLARYLFVAGMWNRKRLGLAAIEKPNPLSRPLAGLQMGVGTALLAPVLHPPYTILISTLVMIPFMGNFFYDWLVVSGSKQGHPYTRKQSKPSLFSPSIKKGLPLLFRGLVVVLLAYRVLSGEITGTSLYIEIFLAAGLALGAGVRLLSLLLLIHVGLELRGQPPPGNELLLSLCGLAIVYLGPGLLSLWTPENSLIHRRLGEKAFNEN